MENDCTLQINQKGLYLACDLILIMLIQCMKDIQDVYKRQGLYLACDLILIMLIQCMKDIQPLLLKHSLRI
ncbi:hypothetical protein AZ024_001847 [Escherichia coli]|nr:hypothetical protein AZ024_001847 [Escherichia coli]